MHRRRLGMVAVAAVLLLLTGCVGAATEYGRVTQATDPSGGPSTTDDPGWPGDEDAPGSDPGVASGGYDGHEPEVLRNLEIGDCVLLDAASEITVGDCDRAHDGEVYHLEDLDGMRSNPENAATAALQICRDEFADYAGIGYTETLLDYSPIWVTPGRWVGARPHIGCIIGDPMYRTQGRLADHDDLLPLSDEQGMRVDSPTAISWDKLIVGDCVEAYTADYVETVVPCDQSHAVEVYGSGELSDETPDDYRSIAEAATAVCDAAIEELPHDADVSAYEFYNFFPDETSWLYGDRLVQCRAETLDGPVTGSLVEPGAGTVI